MAVEVSLIRNFGRERALREKWLKLWDQIGRRLLVLPKYQQDVLLEDFLTAIQSRLMVMERINGAKRES